MTKAQKWILGMMGGLGIATILSWGLFVELLTEFLIMTEVI